MKQLFLPLLFSAFIIASCSDSAGNKSEDTLAGKDSIPLIPDTLNTDTLLPKDSVVNDSLPAPADEPNEKSSSRTSNGPLIEGNVFFNYSYCGGARPSDEMLKQMEQLKPLYTSEIELQTREKSIRITTDKSGVFKANIPAGTYDIYLVKVPARIFDISAKNCATCTTKAIGKVSFPNKMKQISFTFPCGDGDLRRP